MLLATLRKLAALFARTSFCGAVGGGEGGCEGTIDTRPAMSDTRWCEDRRRERGAFGPLPSRGEDGDDTTGDRLKQRELEEPTGERGLGEEHLDCTGERERGPEAKLPEAYVGGNGVIPTIGDGAFEDPLETEGEDDRALRVLARRLG